MEFFCLFGGNITSWFLGHFIIGLIILAYLSEDDLVI